MTRALIPCAGFGTRMGMKTHESKEMIPDRDGKPMIDWSIKLCREHGLDPLIVTRAEKTDLIKHCQKTWLIFPTIIEPKGEWPETILRASGDWGEHNILILPDTRFEPTWILSEIASILEDTKTAIVIATHPVEDSSKWCIVGRYADGDNYLIEKPNSRESGKAMGLIGFKRLAGFKLFKTISSRDHVFGLKNTAYLELDSFNDITRTGKVE